jgi:diguanylate cyclase (GGDEF)-like protein/PAS domain S-box-containing protein
MQDRDLNKERLELALDAAGLDLWENNLVTGEVIRAASRTFVELGYPEEEIPMLVKSSFEIVHPDDREMLLAALEDVMAGRTRDYRCEFRLRTRSGEWVWYANYGRVMDAHTASPGERFIGITFNIDSRKRKEAEIAQINQRREEQTRMLQQLNDSLQQLAATDPLTGLANRRTLMELGEKECKRALRSRHPMSLLMLDIDSFKSINDHWGHQLGDRVICATANICRLNSRSGVDIAARLGGEEFVLMLPEMSGDGAAQRAEHLRQLLSSQQVISEDGDLVEFTVSIGVACFHRGMSMDQLLNDADKALYLAKKRGRNRVARYEETIVSDLPSTEA